MLNLITIFGWIGVLILTFLAASFWTNSERGMRRTDHRIEQLPKVMANRYTAFAVIGAGIVWSGNLPLLALFFAICAWMGLADGAIYAKAGHKHIKHTSSGVLSLVALCVTLAVMAGNDIAWAIGGGMKDALSQIPD